MRENEPRKTHFQVHETTRLKLLSGVQLNSTLKTRKKENFGEKSIRFVSRVAMMHNLLLRCRYFYRQFHF